MLRRLPAGPGESRRVPGRGAAAGGGRHAWPSAAGGRGQLWPWVPGAAVLRLWEANAGCVSGMLRVAFGVVSREGTGKAHGSV